MRVSILVENNPSKTRSSCGAPRFQIPKSVLENLDEGLSVEEVSNLLSISESLQDNEYFWAQQVNIHMMILIVLLETVVKIFLDVERIC